MSTHRVSRRLPIFYGWVQVAITLIVGAVTSGVGFWAFTIFVTPMSADLGWSRAEIYGVLTVRAFGIGLIAPLIGPLQDSRRGPRLFALATAVTMAVSMIAMKWIDDLLTFYILFGLLGSLAQFGSSEMMLSVVLPRWFVRQRGRVLGIGSMGTAMGPLLFPFIATFLLTQFDWRDAWVALGVMTLFILGPMSLLVISRPEDMGLTPDGDGDTQFAPKDNVRLGQRPPPESHDFSRAEAVRMPTFWLIVVVASLTMFGTGGFHANWLPYFRDIGFSAAQGSFAATAYGICSISTRFFWGWTAERFTLNRMMALQALLTGVSVLLFLSINSSATLILAAASNGLAIGGIFVMRPMIVATYFGRGHLGGINGIIRPFITVAGAFSPLLIASIYDLQGSYDLGFVLIAACWALAAAVLLVARQPRVPKSTTPPVV